MGRWVLCVAFAIVACLALKQELWVVASSGCSNHPSTPLHRRTTSDEISQSIDHIPESSPRIHSLMKIRGGKSKSFLSSLVDWFKSVLGIKSKQKNTRYGKKNNDSESKIKVKEPASKGKSPPKKSSETPGQGRLQRVSRQQLFLVHE